MIFGMDETARNRACSDDRRQRTQGFAKGLQRLTLAALLLVTSVWLVFPDSPQQIDLLTYADAVRLDAHEISDMAGQRSASCDVNGDGLTDLLVAAPGGDGPGNTRSRAGEVYVIYGRRGAWTWSGDIISVTDVRIMGQEPYDDLGTSVACGDIDGDGYGDVIMGAPTGDGPGNVRNGAGQIHVIPGGPDLASEIDLLSDPGIVVFGEVDGDNLGSEAIAVGELNSSPPDDLLLSAVDAKNKQETNSIAGRVYFLFGRTNWPLQIDLRTSADVTVYGDRSSDGAGGLLATGDLDGNDIEEAVIAVAGGDGPVDSRTGAGDIVVLRGREVWPPEIDLAVEVPDLLLYGADEDDHIGGLRGLEIVDLDADGSAEVVAGSRDADGIDNTVSKAGESRGHEPGPGFSGDVDLGIESDLEAYGVDVSDYFCGGLRVGDVNGDGFADLICDAIRGDGPENIRSSCGEIHIFFGPRTFPDVLEVANDDQDVFVFGREAEDELAVTGVADLNGDGIDEIVGSTKAGITGAVSSVWLISPVDIDLDGVSQLRDNCPLVANADQADTDGDLIGDACQDDYDGDGQTDGEDCAPGNASGGTPPEVGELMLAGGTLTTLTWGAATFGDEYDISRDDLGGLDGNNYGACQNERDPDLSDTRFEEDQIPPAGSGFFYLVRARNLICPATGIWGTDSAGGERVNSNPAACPPTTTAD